MRSKIALALLGLAAFTQATVVSHNHNHPGHPAKTMRTNKEVKKGHFGATEITSYNSEGDLKMDKMVYQPAKPFIRDYERQARALDQARVQDKVNRERLAAGTQVFSCDNRGNVNPFSPDDPAIFIPVSVGALRGDQSTISYDGGRCFKSITFSYAHQASAESGLTDVTVTIDTENADSLFCNDWFFFATSDIQHVETFYLSGKHQITFANLTADTMAEIAVNGLRIYLFCDGYTDTFLSVYNTVLAFYGGLGTDPNGDAVHGSHVPDYMIDANLKFLSELMGYNLTVRETQDYIDEYDPNLIQSGDFFSVTRLDGVDPIIMYGSGSHAGHSVMALRFDGELYIVESQDGWYWPTHGLQRTAWSNWTQWAKNADFHVSHMPLSPEARARFNETAAQEFFYKTVGLPYGYHNFLFGWIDTPRENIPPILPPAFMPILFSLIEDFAADTVDIFMAQALNKRLGTTGLNMKQIAGEAARRNTTTEALMAMVEVEGWEYHGIEPRDGRSYVCSAYVAALYQAAGIFPGPINGPEFAPRDVYSLDIFDKNFARPEVCQKADPGQPYCQLLGKFRMTHPDYSTVTPYAHMAEHCPTVAPTYVRQPGC